MGMPIAIVPWLQQLTHWRDALKTQHKDVFWQLTKRLQADIT
jgi:hypothetical protein